MSAQTTNPNQSKNGASISHKHSQMRNVAAIFSNHNRATCALNYLIQADFNPLQIDIKPATATNGDQKVVTVRNTRRAITALEILVNAGGDTLVNQAEQLADSN